MIFYFIPLKFVCIQKSNDWNMSRNRSVAAVNKHSFVRSFVCRDRSIDLPHSLRSSTTTTLAKQNKKQLLHCMITLKCIQEIWIVTTFWNDISFFSITSSSSPLSIRRKTMSILLNFEEFRLTYQFPLSNEPICQTRLNCGISQNNWLAFKERKKWYF